MVALIGGISAVIAAAVTALAVRGKKNANGTTVSTGNINAKGDTIVAGRDVTLVKDESDRFFSKNGREILKQATKTIIPDKHERFEWNAFDVIFTTKCIKDSHRGWIFDGKAFQEFREPANDENFHKGVNVYIECCNRVEDKSGKDHERFNKMAEIYWSARKILNPERAAAAEWWFSTGKKSANCDDCMRELFFGQGYMVPGTVFVFGNGKRITDNSPSLVCDNCFEARKEAEEEI
jgi:hypothetical protein